MRSILFVCLGNICRSPAAEGLFRRLVNDRGLEDQVRVDSAGTSSYHVGEPPDSRMRGAAAARGVRLVGAARRVLPEDFARFDLIVAMDRINRRDLLELAGDGATTVRLLSEFLPDGWPADVPDPYYGGEEGFERVLEMIDQACGPMLEHLLVGPPGSAAG
ncbi:MAG TPA: low molecular weight protein-tyrosine-phosphatase [Thermoanaerobaculia bacterium]|nr:low molecular weight protein-tyrosine-phosphatase [Thermoanaerobaculia bacterium]